MASVSAASDEQGHSKKRALQGDNDDELGPALPKRAKTVEDDGDDFGPKPSSSSGLDATRDSSGNSRGEWERVRLQAEVGDVAAVDQLLTESDRAEWMTVLPSERKDSKTLDFGKMQQNVTTFSKRGVQRRGDTSSWTDTPADRAAREAGSASMSSLHMARQLAAQRFQREEQDEARASAAAFNTGSRGMSLYEQLKQGTVEKDTRRPKRRDHESDSDASSDSSSSSDHKRSRSHKHKDRSKDKKSKDKHRHKDKRRDKDKHKDKRSKKEYDEQTPKSLSTADAFAGSGYWDRERDLVSFGSRVSEQTRTQTFREAAMLNSRFYSGGTSTGPSNLRK